ncbi:MAG: TlpA family protein disulfide reductase [Chthonomonadales bacterium]
MYYRKVLLGILTAVVVIWFYYSSIPAQTEGPQGPAPDIVVHRPQGDVHLKDFRGKVVLVDVWATWCGPCRSSIPAIERLYQAKHAQGFEVLGASVDDAWDKVPPFMREMGMTYTVGLLSADQARNFPSIPFMFLVDRQGNIRWKQAGYGPSTEGELERLVDRLLKAP